MNQYRKLVVALVGLVVLFAKRHYGIDLGGTEDALVELVVSGVTAWGVWRVPNTQPEAAKCSHCSGS